MKKALDLEQVFPEVNEITDQRLRSSVMKVWQELWNASEWNDFAEVPTSREIPYSHVPHNRAVVRMAIAVADVFEEVHGVKVDRDLLIAAALLQDASKLVEMRPGADGRAEASRIGKSYPHAFWAAHVALQQGVREDVVHIILTHSPGSPKFPESLEGKILYYVDQLDVLAIYKDRWKKQLMISK